MGFYPDVRPGQPFRPNALLDNDVRHLLNGLNGFIPGKFNPGGNKPAELLSYPCINSTEETLPDRCAVAITTPEQIMRVYPADDFRRPWGILMQSLEPGETGRVAVAGIIDVNAQKFSWIDQNYYVIPDRKNPGQLKASSEYGAPVITRTAETESKCYILLNEKQTYYDRTSPFHAWFKEDNGTDGWRIQVNGGTWYFLNLSWVSEDEQAIVVSPSTVQSMVFLEPPQNEVRYFYFKPNESQSPNPDFIHIKSTPPDVSEGEILIATYDKGELINAGVPVMVTHWNA